MTCLKNVLNLLVTVEDWRERSDMPVVAELVYIYMVNDHLLVAAVCRYRACGMI